MKISLYTDYSFRVLLYLTVNKSNRVTISTIAKYFNISHEHLRKIIHTLSKEGYIKTYLGRNGGMVLLKKTTEINLCSIFSLFENKNWIACTEKQCRILHYCTLHDIFNQAEKSFLNILSKYTLDDLVNNSKIRRSLLDIENTPI